MLELLACNFILFEQILLNYFFMNILINLEYFLNLNLILTLNQFYSSISILILILRKIILILVK